MDPRKTLYIVHVHVTPLHHTFSECSSTSFYCGTKIQLRKLSPSFIVKAVTQVTGEAKGKEVDDRVTILLADLFFFFQIQNVPRLIARPVAFCKSGIIVNSEKFSSLAISRHIYVF